MSVRIAIVARQAGTGSRVSHTAQRTAQPSRFSRSCLMRNLCLFPGRKLANSHWLENFIPIYVCEESLPVQELCATYRACPARAC